MLNTLVKYDTQLLLFLNNHHNATLDKIFWLLSQWYTWIPVFAIIFYMIYKAKRFVPIIFVALLIGLSDLSSTQLFKQQIQRPRPCHNPSLSEQLHVVGNCGGKYGFISSHASNFFALAVFSSLIIRKKIFTITLLTIATVVSYSRIYLGVHYPSDVIGGAIWGALLALLFFLIYKKLFSWH